MKETLLEDLAAKEKVLISDLRNGKNIQDTLAVLKTFPVDAYSVEEWNYCLSYLLGGDRPFQTHSDVSGFLEERCLQTETAEENHLFPYG